MIRNNSDLQITDSYEVKDNYYQQTKRILPKNKYWQQFSDKEKVNEFA